jgi:ABC-type Mn2+/Zn2+ transport system permease subunit
VAGALASAGGLWVSFHYDLPTGPVVVCMFGSLLLVAYALRRVLGPQVEVLAAPGAG